MTHHTPSSPAKPDPRFLRYWQAEAVRLRETHREPLDDAAELRLVLQGPPDLGDRILRRAGLLAEREGLRRHLLQWAASARIALVLVWGLALGAGMGTAAAALGTGDRPVNLALALLALLGAHAATLLIWLLSFLPGATPSTGLSRFWLWLTAKLARSPDAALAAQALASLLARARAWRHVLGGISHGTWIAAFTGALATLLVLLSTRRYAFQWETTLLSPETFVSVAHALGALPAWLGFSVPDGAVIVHSDGLHDLSAAAQAQWSSWLIGCVLAWGLLPRLVAGLASLLAARRRLRALDIDPGLPGWLELRDRLMPRHRTLGIDAPAPGPATRGPWTGPSPTALTGAHAVLGFELGPTTDWPPAGLPAWAHDMGLCDSREDRRRIVDQLRRPPQRLLLACDARQTPDRGTRAWLAELQRLCPHIDVLLLHGPGRTAIWREALDAQGIAITPSLAHWADAGPAPDHD
ncbi:DUF2868 domain-containing protein [Castellaniella sp. GW247-6E4]|uniref:DUF2868 domain-containing protein n=1 Tax=Castellaniella sp. GW247-6E4 TaxID=3140380 RepID=UPI00331556A0